MSRFNQVHKSNHIAVNINVGVLQRVSDSGLRGEMDDRAELLSPEQVLNLLPVADIELHETKPGPGLEQLEPRLLEALVIKRIEIVDPDNMVTRVQQALRQVESYESGAAC